MPAVPGDAQDDERDDEPDHRICNLESEGNDSRRSNDTQADETVHTCMLAVGDKSRTAETLPRAKAYLCSDLVSYEPDDSAKARSQRWVNVLG